MTARATSWVEFRFMTFPNRRTIFLIFALLTPISVRAETGYDMWLRYAPLDDASAAGTAAALARAYPDWWIVPTHLDSPAQAEISSRG